MAVAVQEERPVTGVSPVLAVAFHADGALDVDGCAAIIDHVVAAGVRSALLFGLASEFHKLADDERDVLVDLFVERTADVDGFVTLCSVTDHATTLAVRRARHYVARGAKAINVLPPHFLAPSAASVGAHLDAVIGAVDVPVIVQYAPAQTGTTLDPADLAELARRHPNFRTVKVESNPPGPLIERLAADGIASLVGLGGLHLPGAVAAGAVGVQPGCSLVALYLELWAAVEAGDDDELRRRHATLLPLIAHWMTSVELIVQAEKTVLQRRGVIASDHCRAPGATLDAEALRLIDLAVQLIAFPGHAGRSDAPSAGAPVAPSVVGSR